jgi:fluoride exporter
MNLPKTRDDDSWLPAGVQEFFVYARRSEERMKRVRIVLLLVVFGSIGTLARYGLQGVVQLRAGSLFPAGTLVVNLLGCFLLGGVGQFSLDHIRISADWRTGVTAGFFGAFTTFSTFSWETVHLLDDGDWMRALLYAGLSFLGGLFLLKLGMWLAIWL